MKLLDDGSSAEATEVWSRDGSFWNSRFDAASRWIAFHLRGRGIEAGAFFLRFPIDAEPELFKKGKLNHGSIAYSAQENAFVLVSRGRAFELWRPGLDEPLRTVTVLRDAGARQAG